MLASASSSHHHKQRSIQDHCIYLMQIPKYTFFMPPSMEVLMFTVPVMPFNTNPGICLLHTTLCGDVNVQKCCTCLMPTSKKMCAKKWLSVCDEVRHSHISFLTHANGINEKLPLQQKFLWCIKNISAFGKKILHVCF